MIKMHSKKGDFSASQIFVYIITIIVVGLLLVFGYKSIAGVLAKTQQADYLQFQSQLEYHVKVNKHYGTESTESMSVPQGYTAICFVDYDVSVSSCSETCCSLYPIIGDSVVSGAKKNVFLIKDTDNIDMFFVDKLTVASGSTTKVTVTNSVFKIKFSGQGQTTDVAQG